MQGNQRILSFLIKSLQAPFPDVLLISFEYDGIPYSSSGAIDAILTGLQANVWKSRVVADLINGSYYWGWAYPPPIQKFRVIILSFNGGYFHENHTGPIFDWIAQANATLFMIGSAQSTYIRSAFTKVQSQTWLVNQTIVNSIVSSPFARSRGIMTNLTLDSAVATLTNYDNTSGLTVWHTFGPNCDPAIRGKPAIFHKQFGFGYVFVFNFVVNFIQNAQQLIYLQFTMSRSKFIVQLAILTLFF